MEQLTKLFEFIASIFKSAKRDPEVLKEVAEKKNIENRVRDKRAILKELRIQMRIERAKKRLAKKLQK
jgi:hypothetical protein